MRTIRDGTDRPLHILPINDLAEHRQSDACWCEPAYLDGMVIHNAADGREFFEEEEREALKASLADMAAGRLIPIEEVRRKLDYGS